MCEALGCARQSVIVRKGGIAEGRDGFSFMHREFFLFPTWFHEQPQKVRQVGIEMPEEDSQVVRIKYAARVDVSRTITSWEIAEALAPFHILRPDVIRERFDYDNAPGVHVAFVRVFCVTPTWTFPNEKRYGGCRSWVNLPQVPSNIILEPVSSDAKHNERKEDFLRCVARSTSDA